MGNQRPTDAKVASEKKRLLKLLSSKSRTGVAAKAVQDCFKITASDRTFTFSSESVHALLMNKCAQLDENTLRITPNGLVSMKAELGLGEMANGSKTVSEICLVEGTPTRVSVNQCESPLYRLHRMKTKSGKPYISTTEFAAGERLRSDFERGQLQPRISARLEGNMGSSGKGGTFQANDISDFALDCRARVQKAVEKLGPDLSGVALDICCFLKGFETVERERSWPPRSAKLMLKTSLQLLSDHYGMRGHVNQRSGAIQSWSTEDNRPSLF